MNNNKAKKWLFFFMAVIIMLPAMQYYTNAITGIGLKRFSARTDTSFTLNTWLNGTYQQRKKDFINDTFGFRPDFARLNAQLDFWCFHKMYAGSNAVYPGYDNYLFDSSSLAEYYGLDFIGDEMIRTELWKYKKIQDTFEKLGKTLVITYGPSKPYYYPEKIPGFLHWKGGPLHSNYRSCVRIGDSLRLNQIDFCGWLKAINDTDRCSILAKRGMHWTPYAALLSSDSLIKFFERDKKITMPEIRITSLHRTDSTRDQDDDLSASVDLIFPIKKERSTYANYHFISNEESKKPKVIYIGDSFVWYWLNTGLMANTNSDWQYWFYFNEIWKDSVINRTAPKRLVRNIDWVTQAANSDCLVVLYTCFNLKGMSDPWYTANGLYEYFYPGKK
jgi:hypothetical protein